MAQQAFFTVNLNTASSAPIYVKVGFIPGKIELINLTRMQASPHVATTAWSALWQQGMAQGTAINHTFLATSFADVPNYIATNGITILNAPGSEQGQYGAAISGFSNASSGVITVDSTSRAVIAAGDIIRVANVANDFTGPTLNGDYYVASVTETTITLGTAPAGLWSQTVLSSANTASDGVYVSGGFVTVLQNNNAIVPNPPFNVYSNVPPWFNQAIQGFIIGTNVFPGATYSTTAGDLILVAAYDLMTP